MIVNLENITPYYNKPYIFQHRSGNIHVIPVVYDHNKDLLLQVQEEQFNINVSVIINCMNHNQALDLQHQLLSYIPPNKYMHFYNYLCFLEVDDFLVNPCLFDVSNDKIDNLFLKQNKYTSSLEYSFGLNVEPLLRFNQIDVAMTPDTNETTWQVNLSIEYLLTVPVYLHYPPFHMDSDLGPAGTVPIKRLNVDVSVGDYDYRKLTITGLEPNDNFLKIFNVPIYMNSDFSVDQTINFSGKNNEIVYGKLKGEVVGEIIEFNFESIVDNKVLTGSGKLYHNYSDNKINGDLQGYLIKGKVDKVEFVNSRMLKSWFSGTIDNGLIEKEILLEYTIVNKYKILDNIRTIFKGSPEKNYLLRENVNIIPNNIYKAVGDVIESKTTIIPESSNISRVTLIHKQTKNKLELNVDVSPRVDGNFNYQFSIDNIDNSNQYQENYLNKFIFGVPYGVVLYDFLPEGNYEIDGLIDVSSGEITTIKFEDRDNPNIELDYELDSLHFDNVEFSYNPDCGGTGYIERIHIDLAWNEGSIITDVPNIDIGQFNKYSKVIIIDELYELEETSDSKYFNFAVHIKNIPNLTDINKFVWKLVFPSEIVTTSERNDIFLDTSLSTLNKIIFSVSRNFYFKHLKEVNKTNPLFLSIGQEK